MEECIIAPSTVSPGQFDSCVYQIVVLILLYFVGHELNMLSYVFDKLIHLKTYIYTHIHTTNDNSNGLIVC